MVLRPTPPVVEPSGRSAFGFVVSRTRTASGSRPARASLPPFPPDLPVPGRPPGYRPTGDPVDPIAAPHSFLPDAGLTGDLHDRLLLQRRILVNGYLDDELATRTAAELMYLDGSGDDPIELHLSCPDGELGAANALADTLDLVGVAVRATCLGSIGGPALGPFTAASHRTASMSATFQLRDPRVESSGTSADLEAFAARHRREVDALHRRVAAATGQSVERVAADFATGVVLDADEARRYGIVHDVRRAGPARVTPIRPPTS
jgi:ATP-dependent Clp protease protease subunit